MKIIVSFLVRNGERCCTYDVMYQCYNTVSCKQCYFISFEVLVHHVTLFYVKVCVSVCMLQRGSVKSTTERDVALFKHLKT